MPYSKKVKEVTNKLDDENHKFVFHFNNTIKKCLCTNKFRNNEEEVPGVYVINCKNCNLSYVGETGRQLSKRISEHTRAVNINDQNSAIASHCWTQNHRMNFNRSKIVYRDNDIKRRRVVEGVLINSIPTIPGNKSFSSVDKLNAKHVLRESGLSKITDAASNHDILPVPIHHDPNPCDLNLGLNPPEHQQLGSASVLNERGHLVRRSRRNM